MRLFNWTYSFRKEFVRELRLFIVVTLGFTIAFTWRQTLFDASVTFIKRIFSIEGTVAASITASSLITIICLLLLLLNSKFLKDAPY